MRKRLEADLTVKYQQKMRDYISDIGVKQRITKRILKIKSIENWGRPFELGFISVSFFQNNIWKNIEMVPDNISLCPIIFRVLCFSKFFDMVSQVEYNETEKSFHEKRSHT